MKLHGKRPTRAQREIIKKSGYNPNNWLVAKNTNDFMLIIHKHTGRKCPIRKDLL